MNRLLWLAQHEYLRHVQRKGFLFATLGLPLVFIGGIALIILLFAARTPERAIGYVDQSGILAQAPPLPAANEDGDPYVPLIAFPDEDAARAAYVRAQIDAYVVIPPDYRATGAATLYTRERLSDSGETTLHDFVRGALLAGLPPSVAARATNPIAELTRRTIDGGREVGPGGFRVFLMPTLFALLFLMSVFFSANYLLMGLVEEKENRTMEIVMTSVEPWQLVGGKTLGLGLLGLTQALIWVAAGGLIWAIGATQAEPLLKTALPIDLLVVAALFFIPGYLLYAACMVGIGAMVTSTQEGQQFSSVFSLLALSPFFANILFVTDPNGIVPLIMSFFPLSAPIAMVMRLPLADVPAWQIAASLVLVFLAYPDEAAARAAVGASEIDLFYVVPPDYLQTGAVTRYARQLGGSDQEIFQALLRANLLDGDARIAALLEDPLRLKTVGLDAAGNPANERTNANADGGLQFVVPYVFAMLLYMTVFFAASFLLQSVTEEKENVRHEAR